MSTRTTVRVAASALLVTIAVAGAAVVARRAQLDRAPPASGRGVEEPPAPPGADDDARPLRVLDVRRTRDDAPVDRIRAEYRFADGSREPLPGSPFHTAPKGTGRHALRVPRGAVALRVTAPRLAGETLDLAGCSDGEVVALLLPDAARDAGGSGD